MRTLEATPRVVATNCFNVSPLKNPRQYPATQSQPKTHIVSNLQKPTEENKTAR
jgi:hypothetical protein